MLVFGDMHDVRQVYRILHYVLHSKEWNSGLRVVRTVRSLTVANIRDQFGKRRMLCTFQSGLILSN